MAIGYWMLWLYKEQQQQRELPDQQPTSGLFSADVVEGSAE